MQKITKMRNLRLNIQKIITNFIKKETIKIFFINFVA
jgi:hypothetical protein